MDQPVRKHVAHDAADPAKVIVTLYRCRLGNVRGWFVGPPSFDAAVPMNWYTSPDDNLLGPVALVRGMEIARKLNLDLCVVDPDHLWEDLQGDHDRSGLN